jgi:hypothetical protein
MKLPDFAVLTGVGKSIASQRDHQRRVPMSDEDWHHPNERPT